MIAGIPLIVLVGVCYVLASGGDLIGFGKWWDWVWVPVSIACGIAALVYVVRYRGRRRLVTVKLLPVEIILGMLIGTSFLFVLLTTWAFAALE